MKHVITAHVHSATFHIPKGQYRFIIYQNLTLEHTQCFCYILFTYNPFFKYCNCTRISKQLLQTRWMFQCVDGLMGKRNQECLSNLGYLSTQHHTSSMPHKGREGYMFWMSCKVASISSCSSLFFSFSATRSSGNNVGQMQYTHIMHVPESQT